MASFDVQKFLNTEFNDLDSKALKIQKEKELNRFNLFTLSSYNSYLENFHSDIISMLLDPEERHNHSSKFFSLFFEYLIAFGISIKMDDYALPEITREKGRIDIWIKDNTSKRSIIIENKINNAVDQDNQLQNYYDYATTHGFEVDAIIYLTLNDQKKAPLTNSNTIDEKVINISAFSNKHNDLCNGWLKRCYDISTDEDARSFIYQYLKVIKHLSQEGMDREIKNEFYRVVSTTQGFDKVKVISSLNQNLEKYRADLFFENIREKYFPFTKTHRYRPNHWLFENYYENGIKYKLDVYFHSDGSARIDFWIPAEKDYEGPNVNIINKLRTLNLLHSFESGGFGGGMYRAFELKEYNTIANLDNAILEFVKDFCIKLRQQS